MDWQSIQPFFHWLADHSILAGLFVFLIAFSESLLIVGLIVPGTLLMFGVGTLVGAGALDFWNTIIIAFFGAIAGDAVSFLIGKHYHDRVVKVWPFNKHPDYMEKGENFFKKHGGISILIGRFVGPVRPIIPAVAGMMGMSQSYFLFVNILSAAGWAPFYLIPGIVFGSSIALAAAIGTRLVILFLIVLSLIVTIAWLLKAIYLSALPWYQKNFMEWYTKTTVSRKLLNLLLDHEIVEKRGALLLSILSFFLVVFIGSLFVSANLFGFGIVDEFIYRLALFLQWQDLNEVIYRIDQLFNWSSMLFIYINLLLLTLFFKQYQPFLRVTIATVFSILSVVFIYYFNTVFVQNAAIDLTILVEQVRIVCMLICLFVFMMLIDEFFVKTKEVILLNLLLLTLLVLLMANVYFSRLPLSDISLLIGVTVMWVTVILWGGKNQVSIKYAATFGISSFCILLLFVGLKIPHLEFDKYQQPGKIVEREILDRDLWWNGKWEKLDASRQSLSGESGYKLNVQFDIPLNDLRKTLSKYGWEQANPLGIRNMLLWLSPKATLYELGELPGSHFGQRDVLTLYKSLSEIKTERLRLRIWQQSFTTEQGTPFLVAELSFQALGNPGYLFNTIDTRQTNEELENFRNQMLEVWDSKIVYSKNRAQILLLKSINQ